MRKVSYISYMERTREFYAAQGFEVAYQWAHYDDVPFAAFTGQLSEARVGIVTTAYMDQETPMMARQAEAVSVEQVPLHFLNDDLSWDKETTHMADRRSYFPLETLQNCVAEGRLGSLSSRFYFAPTQYSQRLTIEQDAPAIVRFAQEDALDAVLLVPI